MTSVAMTIAGSDPSGGAGIQADLKTFHQHGVYGTSVLTLLTVQNTRAVGSMRVLDAGFVIAQLEAVIEDLPPLVAKTGALGSAAVIEAIGERAKTFGFPLVVDPVMVSKHGHPLLEPDAADRLMHRLLPHAMLVTPNMPEATVLSEREVVDVASMEKAAATIALRGVPNVLVKGGRLPGQSVDVLYADGEIHRFAAARIESEHTHGTGCVFSAAITARLALGEALPNAIQGAKSFVTHAIRTSPKLGHGCGPVNLNADVPPPVVDR